MNKSKHHSVRKHTRRNFREISSSTECGCLSCTRIFEPSKIVEWAEHCNTAICPYCEEKSVLGSASGYPITDEFIAHIANDESDTKASTVKTKQVSYKYQSAFSIPSVLSKSVSFPGLLEEN